jgi:TolB protein
VVKSLPAAYRRPATGHRLVLAGLCAVVGLVPAIRPVFAADRSVAIGVFEDSTDVGSGLKPGSLAFDQAPGTYRVTGGGQNMWFTNDAFHYVWKRVSGDVTLAADIAWPAAGGNAHRKACLVIRQTLDADSAYADAAVHGDGLTSLQSRETSGDLTHEIQSNVAGPTRLRIEKRGDYVSMSVAPAGEALRPAGGSFRVQFKEPFYIGLAVCAHESNVLETAVFSNVEITVPPPAVVTAKPAVTCTLETITLASKDRRVVYHTSDLIEAPNWSHDGTSFLFNSKGHIYQLPIAGGEPRLLDTGLAVHCNNDHGISPDGKYLAISDSSEEKKSLVYVLPITGGTPRRLTPAGPSYWHGWSPDGKTLAYCAERQGEFDVYTVPVDGGEEKRLTTAPGLDDGPEYSPDGNFIYFNSERSGLMQIWRMKPDGTAQEEVTSDDYNNWFAHPSPNGKWIVFLSYPKEVKGHPENKDVMLRLMQVGGREIQTLAKFFGGQGTINVPSWSPDSRKVAFVSYQIAYP